ncbi:MAG: ATP-grasp domain-containing protein [Clostridiales bacterium]|nr:ATP-grasp domain-containing protein [Clostridiales bacterium]
MPRKIVIIGASDLQNPLILKAKSMGFETHVFAWASGDIGEKTADFFYPVSIVEKEQILECCRQIKPDAVATIASDLAAVTVNYLANALGLPSNPPETAFIASNKFAMRGAFREAGIPTPAFVKVAPGDDLSLIRAMQLPIIVKPTDRSGSRGIRKLTSFDGLEEAIAESVQASFEKKAIVEEYIEGEEYSFESISQNGVHHYLNITKKFTTGTPHFIETGHLEPSDLDEETIEAAKAHIFRALDALHITTGAGHAEFKVLPGTKEIRLIEIGARMGGDCIGSDLVQLTTGYDFVKMVIQAATGDPLDLSAADTVPTAVVRYTFNDEDIAHYETLCREHPDKLYRASQMMRRKVGEAVTDSSTRCGFYILTGSSQQEVCELSQLPLNK